MLSGSSPRLDVRPPPRNAAICDESLHSRFFKGSACAPFVQTRQISVSSHTPKPPLLGRISCQAPNLAADPAHLLSPGKQKNSISGFLPENHTLDVQQLINRDRRDGLFSGVHDCHWHEDGEARVRVHTNRVDVFFKREHLRVYEDGMLELRHQRNGICVLITAGRVQSTDCSPLTPGTWSVSVLDERHGAVQMTWLDGSLLTVVPAGAVSDLPPSVLSDISSLTGSGSSEDTARDASWAKGLSSGFLCEFSVLKNHPSGAGTLDDQLSSQQGCEPMAEVELNMRLAGHWFGGGHYMRQHWPLDLGEFEVGPFFPFDNGPNGTNTLLAPNWMTTAGLLVLANPDTPFLHVGLNAPVLGPHDGWIQRTWGTGVQNLAKESLPRTSTGNGDGMLRLQARGSYQSFEMLHPLLDWLPPAWRGGKDTAQRLSLQFALCAHGNVKEAAEAALKTLPRPPNPPPREMVNAPIWTTWARYHAKVSQSKVEQFAHEIVSKGLTRSVMEIDDKWQTLYGDFTFDPAKFPNPKEMVALLHDLGFKVTLWIMPFAEEASEAYKEGGPKGYFISSSATTTATKGLKPGFFRWWQPVPAAALDVTNPEAVAWFVSRLKKLQSDYSIDGFKFDAGEPCFLPRGFITHKPILTPTDYTRLYIQQVASHFDYSEVRTGHKTGDVPLLTRMGDRFSTWSTGNGLRSVIPTLLTSGLLGYPFCLPDMIGGNAYFGRKPDVELLVRWAQANALMPAMQFSIAPWDLSKEAEKLCRGVLELREKLSAYIFCLMEEACKKLTPVCRPMWWLDPEDPETFTISDQFAIGDDIIVAPVVVKGQKRRDIYLPAGTWCELLNPHAVFEGPQWIRGVSTPLHILPIYRRVAPCLAEDRHAGGEEVGQERDGVAAVPALAAAAVAAAAAAAAAVPAVAAAVAAAVVPSMPQSSRSALKDASDAIDRDLAMSSAAAAIPAQSKDAVAASGRDEQCGCAAAAASGVAAMERGATERHDDISEQQSSFDLGATLRAVADAVKGWRWGDSKGNEVERRKVQWLQQQQHMKSDLPVCIHDDIGAPYCLLAERPADGEFNNTSIA